MDFYGDDRKLSELSDHEFNDFLDHDVFTPSTSSSSSGTEQYGLESMDNDWLDSFFEDPVLNDRMISDALQPPHIQSEHSYSLANSPETPAAVKTEPLSKESDTDLIPAASQCTSPFNLSLSKASSASAVVKSEPEDNMMEVSTTPITSSLMMTQPTIILTTNGIQNGKVDRLVLPRVNIKLEPQELSNSSDHSAYDSIGLPPTPPSSSNSDSEGGSSPQRSAPSSPIRHSSLSCDSLHGLGSPQAALFSSPIPTSGMLLLSEEEKRTLISEGYPIPTKLPLTKQEEKNLKKIRRKIKNKISAQESRRKKKEYMETLEKRVEAYNHENGDLKKKIEQLENNNRSLLSQLQKMQSVISKVTKQSSAVSPASTCLMVLVLCFAVLMGSWSPMASLSIGYRPSNSAVSVASNQHKLPMGPSVRNPTVDSYNTPNIRSRVLLSIQEMEDSDVYGPATPFSKDIFLSLFSDASESQAEMEPEMPHTLIANQGAEKEDPGIERFIWPAAAIAANITASLPPLNTTV